MPDLLRTCHESATNTAAWCRQHGCHQLQAELEVYHSLLNEGTDQARNNAATRIRQLLKDDGYDGVREQAALARLPAAERAEWQKLWADVAATLAQAEKQSAP